MGKSYRTSLYIWWEKLWFPVDCRFALEPIWLNHGEDPGPLAHWIGDLGRPRPEIRRWSICRIPGCDIWSACRSSLTELQLSSTLVRGIQAQLGIEKGLVKPWEEHGTIIEHSSIFLIEHGFGFGFPCGHGAPVPGSHGRRGARSGAVGKWRQLRSWKRPQWRNP